MSKQSLLRGAIMLVAANVITKILGMILQVVVTRQLGAEGFGLFRSVWPLMGLLITLSSVALPIALSKVIAEAVALGDVAKVRRSMWMSGITVTVLSVLFSSLLIFLAPWVTAKWMDTRAYYPVLAMAVWTPLICISWVVRGYYQGIQNQTQPSIGWIIETVVRTAITIPLVFWANRFGLQYAAVAVMIGMGAGEVAGFWYIYHTYRTRDRHLKDLPPLEGKPELPARTARALAEVALPTTFQRILLTLAYAVEPIILYSAFASAGIGKGTATALYGSIGMAFQLLVLPTVFTYSLSTILVPAVSEAAALNNRNLIRLRLNQTIRATLVLGFPATVLFLLLGRDIAMAIYRDALAGSLLVYVAPIAIFLYMLTPFSGILQGLNKAGLSTVIALFQSGIKLLFISYFVSKPGVGIYGFANAISISIIVATLLYFWVVKKLIDFEMDLMDTLKMLLAAVVFAMVVLQIKLSLASALPVTRVLAALGIGGIIYFLSLFCLNIIRADMLERVPRFGPRLANLLKILPRLK